MALAGAEEKHRRAGARLPKRPKSSDGAHRQFAPVMRYALGIERAAQMGNGLGIVLAMHEDVLIGDRRSPRPAVPRGVAGKTFRLGAELLHARIGQRAQRRPDLGVAGGDPEGRLAHPGMGHRHEREPSTNGPPGPSAVSAGISAATAGIGDDPVLRRRGVGGLAREGDAHPARGAVHRPPSSATCPSGSPGRLCSAKA